MNLRFEPVCTHEYASHGWYLLDRMTGQIVERILTRVEAAEMAFEMNKQETND